MTKNEYQYRYSGCPVGVSVWEYTLYVELYRNTVFEKSFNRLGILYTDVDELFVLPNMKFYVTRAFGDFAFVLYVPEYIPRHLSMYRQRERVARTSNHVYAHTVYDYTGIDVSFSK